MCKQRHWHCHQHWHRHHLLACSQPCHQLAPWPTSQRCVELHLSKFRRASKVLLMRNTAHRGGPLQELDGTLAPIAAVKCWDSLDRGMTVCHYKYLGMLVRAVLVHLPSPNCAFSSSTATAPHSGSAGSGATMHAAPQESHGPFRQLPAGMPLLLSARNQIFLHILQIQTNGKNLCRDIRRHL